VSEFKEGDIVYLTPAAQDYLSRNRGTQFTINVIGRLGYILEIYDWNTKKGKEILEKRKSNPKWDKLPGLEFKYVIVTNFPELKKDEASPQGMTIPDLFPEFHPMADGKKIPLFRKWATDLLSATFAFNEEMTLTEKSSLKEKASTPKTKEKGKVKNVSRPNGKPSPRKSKKLS
jgi:hypothetical protein